MPDPNTLASVQPQYPQTLGSAPPPTPDAGAIGQLHEASALSHGEHYLLSVYGDLLNTVSGPLTRLAEKMSASPTATYALMGRSILSTAKQLEASSAAYKEWSQGFPPIDFSESITNPVVNREQLANVLMGAVPAAQVARAVPGAVRDAARDFAEASGRGTFLNPQVPRPAAPFAKYAEEYPPVPPAEMKVDPKNIDPKTGKPKEFVGRGSSPESEAFMAARRDIQKDLDKGNYRPYFNIEQRFDANPEHYPTAGETIRDTRPVKPETYAGHLKEINTPEARKRLIDAYQAGLASGGHDRWYQMGQLEREFVNELGPEEGRRQFKLRFADAMAATTGGADPRTNLMSSAYGNVLASRGLPIPKSSAGMPVPTSGLQLAGNVAMHGELQSRRFIPYDNPKRHNFSANFSGHRGPSTIDEQMTDLITPGKASPGDKYAAYEQTLKDAAAEVGVDPRDFQDVAWGGKKWLKTGGKYRGKPMIEHVNEAIERTSRLTGQSPQDVLRGFIHGRLPLYGLTGATVGTGATLESLKGEGGGT